MRVAVIGSGPAALSALHWLEDFGLDPLWFSESEEIGGTTRRIFNPILDFPLEPDGNAHKVVEFLNSFSQRLKAKRIVARVEEVASVDGGFRLSSAEQNWTVDRVILATGTKPRHLGILGEAELAGRGVFQSCSRYKDAYKDQDVLVVGGGDAAFEGAYLLAQGGARVRLVVRSKDRARAQFRRLVDESPVEIVNHAKLEAIESTSEGLKVKLRRDGRLSEEMVAAVFVRIGVNAETPQLPELERDAEGYIRVDQNMESSFPGIYAAGDVRVTPLRSIITAMGDGAIAAAAIHASI